MRCSTAAHPRTYGGGLAAVAVYCIVTTLAMTGGCLAFYNTRVEGGTHAMPVMSFGTWLSRQSFAAGCPDNAGRPCHVYLSVPLCSPSDGKRRARLQTRQNKAFFPRSVCRTLCGYTRSPRCGLGREPGSVLCTGYLSPYCTLRSNSIETSRAADKAKDYSGLIILLSR